MNTVITTDEELLQHIRSLFPEQEELQEHLTKIETEKDYYDLIPGQFFWYFPGNGAGLEKVFSVIEKGDEILPRLLYIFSATEDSKSYYFLPNGKTTCTDEEREELARKYLRNLLAIIDFTGENYPNDFLEDFRKDPPVVELVKVDTMPEREDEDDFSESVYELYHEFIYTLTKTESLALQFREALYQMACSYDVVHYVLWPLYEADSTVKDPFKIIVDCWIAGIEFSFDDENNILRAYTLK